MARFRVALPEMTKLSCRISMAARANTKRNMTRFKVRIPGWISLILLLAVTMLMDEKTEETRIQPEPFPKNSAMLVSRV